MSSRSAIQGNNCPSQPRRGDVVEEGISAIQDDNFSSIVKTVLWGRSVFSNLRKFLQFQLTINGVALVIAFVAAVTTGETPLGVLELLWVNLIMDALAALGLPFTC